MYGYTHATFGDLIAGLGSSIDPLAAQQLQDNTYVDDSVLGGSCIEVERMRGQKEKSGYTGTITQILNKGAMTVKFMAISGSSDPWKQNNWEERPWGWDTSLRRTRYAFSSDPVTMPANKRQQMRLEKW